MTTIAMEEYELMKDSKYRMYVAAVDKALKSFEYTSEWADLISALGKLNKVVTLNTKFPVIPRRIKISKRLAQCMHPALPSGVHLKALETYDIIFRCMGTNRLSHELFIYSAGLFPLLGHAAMNIRPTLLTIYETHFVPLRERLRPALSGFLSGVLPGLEPGSDHFERTNTLLENVCEGVGPSWFYTCIWQCVRSNSPVRLPAISFVLAHYSRKVSMEDQLYLMGNDIDVMICGLSAAVQDSSVLVQRSALDLLMVCFPMQNTQLLYADMVRLVTAALTTILRRDMSLNRRLYSWLLDTEVNTPPVITQKDQDEEDTENTESNIKTLAITFDLLNEAIRVILKQSSAEVPIDIKPYRLLTSLFEKPQIGPVILDSILYDVFRALYLSCLHQQKDKKNIGRCVSFNGDIKSLKNTEDVALSKEFLNRNCQDLIKNANLLFNTLQSYYIWSYIEKFYTEAVINVKHYKKSLRDQYQVNEIGSGAPGVLEICVLTDFLLDIIPIETYADNTSEILPNLFNKIVTTLKSYIDLLNKHEVTHSLRLCTKVLSKIQPLSVVPVPKPEAEVVKMEVVEKDERDSEEVVSTVETPQIEIAESKGLEKSKSDSKLNEKMNKNELSIEDSRERSNSNQMLKKKEKTSPKIDKKSKNKKSKSSSKLYDLKNEENETLIVETVNLQSLEPLKLVTNTTKVENKHFMRCLDEYKEFYVALIKSKIIPDVNIPSYFNTMRIDTEERTRELELMLDKCLRNESILSVYENTKRTDLLKINSATKVTGKGDFDNAISVASNVLLEFSTFSNLLNEDESDTDLPYWLQSLIVSACCPQASDEVKIVSMNVLLEIFSLAKSQKSVKSSCTSVNVVVMGILEAEHVRYIEDHTVIIQTMSQILWDLLGQLTNQIQLMLCVTLLYNIHNIFDKKLFVEDVVGKYLIEENLNVEFFKRFSILWHLGRDLNIRLPAHQNSIRNFDRTLLKILDNLRNIERSNLKLLSETFLTHALLRNDIARILNPMLAKLLAPHTARISIRHVNIHDTDSQADVNIQENQKIEDEKAKKVYAVSNVNGNVMYHVTDSPSPKVPKKKWFLFSKTGKKYTQVVNITTSVTDNLGVVTKKNKDFKNDISPNIETNKNTVKLFINPMSSREIYPNGLNGSYTKLGSNFSKSSSSESLASDMTPPSCDSPANICPSVISHGHDSGFESIPPRIPPESLSSQTSVKVEPSKRNLLERIEPISDGIKAPLTEESVKLMKSKSFDEKSNIDKKDDLDGGNLVHSWSYCISDSDNLNAELEMSTCAEDFFKGGDLAIVSEVLNGIINRVCGLPETSPKLTRPMDLDLKPKISDHVSKNFSLYPIHYHLCLYYEVFDSNQVLYALKTLKNCILSNPQLFIRCLATSGLKDLKNNDILYLLARHRKSILGSAFSGEVCQEHVNFYRGYTFLDIIIAVSLNFSRSFYPSLDDHNLTSEEMNNNLKIQIASLEVLDIIIRNLLTLVKENSKGFSRYIGDMLVKCKLQKVLLHCLLTSVRNFDEDLSFAEEVLIFNNFRLHDSNNKVGEHVEAFQTQLLRLIHSLIILEYHVFPLQEANNNSQVSATPTTGEHLSYTPTILIPKQQMFLSAIMSALRHQNMKNLHEKWCNMVTLCLPYFAENLKQISLSVIHQICNNIEEIANSYKNSELEGELCSDYAVTQLESLTILCHYCLLDSSQTVNQTNVPNSSTPLSNPSEILNNLVNAFFSPMANDLNHTNKQNSDHYQTARKTILSHMPRIISSVAKLWQTIVSLENEYSGIYGNSKVVKQQLLEFLSPISVHHSGNFLAAVAVAWYERRNIFSTVKTVLPEPNASQMNLVYLISAIRVIPLDNLVQTVTAVIKNPPHIEGLNKDICLDVCVLELFYCYMRNASSTQLAEAWGSLLTLVREGCSLSPPAQFLLGALLHELMIKCCPLEERKDQKDLQDVTAKLIECVSQVCGSCLEQTTWLRRNLAVREQDEDATASLRVVSGNSAEILNGTTYSVQAQLVLSEILAPILDICFGSSEKDKVNTVLTSLMYNIVPYLRTHTVRNMPSFQACSKLLASLSSYQYTRKAWKKDVYDLLLDNAFFQMDCSCLKYWKIIVDNLMTHDNTTFRDLMSRVSETQSGSLSLFSSREQEYEQRAQLLKRLAFVIFCSEIDQYAKYMPDIQEQLTSSLRLSVPSVQAQVFLCFRVILLRMTPMHITSLWPIIISEMLQVFLQIEQELSTDSEEFSSHIKLLSSLDASWATNSNNGLHALGHPHWLRLQLATVKLLDLALLLPATTLPQFQMYRWAFVGDDLANVVSLQQEASYFVPHVTRIANLMDQKFADTQLETLPTKQNELLLTVNSITQLKDLHGFFKTLSLCSNRHRTECNGSIHHDHMLMNDRQIDKNLSVILEKLDKIIELDFLDKIARINKNLVFTSTAITTVPNYLSVDLQAHLGMSNPMSVTPSVTDVASA